MYGMCKPTVTVYDATNAKQKNKKIFVQPAMFLIIYTQAKIENKEREKKPAQVLSTKLNNDI